MLPYKKGPFVAYQCSNHIQYPVRTYLYRWAIAALCMLCVAPNQPLAAAPCQLPARDILVRETRASAGFFANLRNADHSINAQMDTLLGEARAAADTVSLLSSSCRTSCHAPTVVAVVFTSSPNMALDNYDEFSTCQGLFQTTINNPIVYANRTFASEKEAKAWYKALTQGDGPDGEDLYRRCPGKCSPSYSSIAYQWAGRFIVTTSIRCGHARDKDDDQYLLSASLRRVCPQVAID